MTTGTAELAQAEETPAQEPLPAERVSEPAARPSLWVPPSAIAPPRAVAPAAAPSPTEIEPIRETPAPEPFPRPAATTLAAAPAPQTAAVSAEPVVAPASVRPTPVSPAAVEGRFAAVAATVERMVTPGTFEPGDGPVVLRIAPISGFQGLMRVQDAVVQHPPVREATVEAYARGEARLRLQLVSALDAEQLASTLVRSLGLQARVESVSDEERSIQVTLA